MFVVFSTSWECEAALSQIGVIKAKFRNRLNVAPETRVTLSSTVNSIAELVQKSSVFSLISVFEPIVDHNVIQKKKIVEKILFGRGLREVISH